nr:neprilysin-1-like [Dermacentor andersoni]
MQDMVYSWLFGFETTLREGSKIFPIARIALIMFQTCMGNSSVYGSTIEEFRLLLNNLSLAWPEKPRADVDALGALISLAYHWRVELWVSMRVFSARRNAKTSNWIIEFAPAPQLPFYLRHHRSVNRHGGYSTYWSQFYQVFTNTSPTDNLRHARDAANLEGNILKKLNEALHVSPRDAAQFPIGEIQKYTPNLAFSRWLRHLQHTTTLSPALTVKDEIVVTNVKFLATVGELFQNYTNQDILSYLAWQFVEHYGPIADSRLLLSRYGDQRTADRLRPAFCATQVEAVYKLMLLSLAYTLHIKNSEKDLIDRSFNRLVSAAVRLVNASGWLDPESRNAVTDKLLSATMQVWPPASFLTNESLEEIYKNFPGPGQAESFGGYWIRSLTSLRTIKRSPDYEYMSDLLHSYALPYLQYDYHVNKVDIAIGAVARPLFYSQGTNAMFYGGIGFSLAFELVKALDLEGLQWHSDGVLVSSILSESSRSVYEVKENCLNSSEESDRSLFPDIPALEIAYSVYLDASKNAENALQISEDLTETRVFFLTMCYMTCSREGFSNPSSANCNKVVRNSIAFANAFGCPLGSKMNPVKKCIFFG